MDFCCHVSLDQLAGLWLTACLIMKAFNAKVLVVTEKPSFKKKDL